MEPDSPETFFAENWVRFHYHENQESQPQNDDDEASSLCDIATSNHDDTALNHPEKPFSDEHEEEFDFGGGSSNLPEKEMCSADELFFRGQILPLRYSVTWPSGFMTRSPESTRSISFSRSESVSVASSRSSSTSGSDFTGYEPIKRNRNQFHSHPSPIPQIRTRGFRNSNPKSSLKWNILQLGPLKPQEIVLADLKNRRERSHGNSRKGKDKDQNEKKKKKQILFGGCKCSANVIESTVSSRISMVKPTILKEVEEENKLRTSKQSTVGKRKDALSSHRASEWLKQLSIQENTSRM